MNLKAFFFTLRAPLMLAALLLACFLPASAQQVKAFYVGHSLSDQIPDMVASLSQAHSSATFDGWAYQTIPGAPLRWQWQRKDANDYLEIEPFIYPFYHPTNGLPNGQFDVLVLTESVPRYWSILDETYQYADSFLTYGRRFRPDLKVYLYEDWHCLQSGTPTGCDYDIDASPWRQRLTDDLPMWESVVDSLNSLHPGGPEVCLIPGGQGLARLHDSIAVGRVPGLADISDLFSDDIHLNDAGKYFIACIHFAMLHGISPEGLPAQLSNMWGVPFQAPTADQAAYFQALAWRVAREYPRSCLESAATSLRDELPGGFQPFPNPASGLIRLSPDGSSQPFRLFDLTGRLLQSGSAATLNLGPRPAGWYWLELGNRQIKVLKSE